MTEKAKGPKKLEVGIGTQRSSPHEVKASAQDADPHQGMPVGAGAKEKCPPSQRTSSNTRTIRKSTCIPGKESQVMGK